MSRRLQPPGETGAVHGNRVLVLAPHYDDEVLGCGGLLARLAAAGAQVRVLFLTDGGGGREPVADREAYRRERRREAEAAAQVLGLAGVEHLGLPDGGLGDHLEETGEGIRGALLRQEPDLLLAPSPLEVSRDHRGAFAALHRVLSPLRGGSELDQVTGGLRVLLYEVNQPAYPDLLVDVTREIPKIEAAMACYRSQQARHDYLRAALGLRRYRTLSLPPEVEAAEGYRQLQAADFATRSLARLIQELGGTPELVEVREGPKISVVVRTKDRPGLLAEALTSLAGSTYRKAEVVVVNDGGQPPELPADFPLALQGVDLSQNRGRAAAADAGVKAATGDFVAFLDDDDLAYPEHLATLARLVSGSEIRVAYTDAAVGIYELDGEEGWRCAERRLPYSRDYDPDLLLLDNYIPFNTLLIHRPLFPEVGSFDRDLPFFEDWDFLIRLSRRVPFYHLPQVTCEYRHFRGGGHHIFGERPRERADFLEMKAKVVAKHAAALTPEVLARAVDRLRLEGVEKGEELVALQEELAALRQELAELADQFHRRNGELVSLKGDYERLLADHRAAGAELRRLYDEEKALRQVVEDQTEHLGRTYAEIERLNGLIREMEATRAWRLHQWWQRRFS